MDLSVKQRLFHSASKFQSKVYLNFILDLQSMGKVMLRKDNKLQQIHLLVLP